MAIPADKLSRVISQFSFSAGVFYSGQLCGLSSFDDPGSQTGHLHFLRQGKLEVIEPRQTPVVLEGPALLFYPRPVRHQIKAEDADNTVVVCASVNYGTGPSSPLATSDLFTIRWRAQANRRHCRMVIRRSFF